MLALEAYSYKMKKFKPPTFQPLEMHSPYHSKSFAESVVGLIFHILGSAVLFLVFASVSWALGYAVHLLGMRHPFNPSVLSVLHSVELWLLYIDICLSGMVLLVGAYRFILEIGGRR